MFTTTKTVDLTMLYVREGKNPDSDTSRGTGGGEGRGNSTNDIVYLQLGARKVSVYGQSFDFTRSSTFDVYDCQRVLLVGHACTYISVLSNYLSFSPSVSATLVSLCANSTVSSTNTNESRGQNTYRDTHTCPRNGVKIRVATLLARHCCVAANSRRTRPPLGNRQPQG